MSLTRRAFLSVGLTAALTSVAALSRVLLKQTASARAINEYTACLLYTSPSPRDRTRSRMPSSA